MHIHGPAHLHGPQSINAPHHTQPATPAAEPLRAYQADEVNISREADLVSRARDLPDVRLERVAEIRQQIQAGLYETPEKLDLALDRLLDELA